MSNALNSKGKTHASSLIDQGKVDKSTAWTFNGADGNAILGDPPDWAEYSKWFLGHATEGNSETKGYWKYPHGKNGKVYRSALIAARQRSGQQKDTEIFNAAGALLTKIDGKKYVDEITGQIFDVETGKLKDVRLNTEGHFLAEIKEFKSSDGTSGDGEGDQNFYVNILASTPDIDRMGDIVDPHAFDGTVDKFLKVGVILNQHDPNQVIGVPVEARVTNRGLEVKAMISETAPKIKQLVKEGILRQASIGFRVLEHEFKQVADQVILYIKKLDLFEVSLVAIAANPYTEVSMAKAFYSEIDKKDVVVEDAVEEQEEGVVVEDEKATSETPQKLSLAFEDVVALFKALTDDQALELKDLVFEKFAFEKNENETNSVIEDNNDNSVSNEDIEKALIELQEMILRSKE